MEGMKQIAKKWNNLDPINQQYLLGILESLDFAQQNTNVSQKLSKVQNSSTKPTQNPPTKTA